MTPEKRRKIKALLDNPASTENEKEICRKILRENPEDSRGRPVTGYDVRGRVKFWHTQRSRQSGDFWRQAVQGATQNQQNAARRQREAAYGARVYPSTDDLADMLRQARKEQQTLWNDMRHHMEDMKLKPGPLTDFYKELDRLRKERDK
jgi:hypothetical protein